jgi:hypothetical protein
VCSNPGVVQRERSPLHARDFMAYFDGFANELGVAMPRARGTGVRKPLKRVLTPVAFQ